MVHTKNLILIYCHYQNDDVERTNRFFNCIVHSRVQSTAKMQIFNLDAHWQMNQPGVTEV